MPPGRSLPPPALTTSHSPQQRQHYPSPPVAESTLRHCGSCRPCVCSGRTQRALGARLSRATRLPAGLLVLQLYSTAFMRRLTRVPVLPVGVLVQLYYLVLPVVRSLRGTIGGLQSYVSAQCRQTGKSKCMRRGALLALALAGDGDHAHLGLPAAAARASAAHSCEGHCAKIACVGGCSAICMWRAAHL